MRFISRFKPYDMHHLRFKMLINLVYFTPLFSLLPFPLPPLPSLHFSLSHYLLFCTLTLTYYPIISLTLSQPLLTHFSSPFITLPLSLSPFHPSSPLFLSFCLFPPSLLLSYLPHSITQPPPYPFPTFHCSKSTDRMRHATEPATSLGLEKRCVCGLVTPSSLSLARVKGGYEASLTPSPHLTSPFPPSPLSLTRSWGGVGVKRFG